jgi:hypothetical protein
MSYLWRRLSEEQRKEVLEYRLRHQRPWRRPPHFFLETGIKTVAEKIGPPAARELLDTTDLTPDERAALGKTLDEMKPPARP